MWPITDAFRAAMRRSHKVISRVDVISEGVVIGTIYPIDGSVSVDSRRAVRRTMSMSVVDEDGTLTPTQGARVGLLTPYGTELAVYRGIEYDDGTRELVPVGVFLLTEVTVAEDGNGEKISLQGSDRSLRISRNKLLDPYRIASGTSLEDGLVGLLRDRWVDVQTDFPVTGVSLPDVVIEAERGGDPWSAAVTIAEAFGYDLAFSPDGIARMQLIPDPVADDPVEIYQDGADAVVTSLTRTFDSQRAYNAIVVTAQGTANATPFRVIAWDENPNSITYRYGPFGEVPFFYESSLITSAEQAAVTAAALLRKATGQSESVSWGQIVNPAHDVLDVVRLKRQAKSLDLVLLIDRLDVPLGPEGTMNAVARTQEVQV
jgi:hypothetical protein